MYTVESQSGKWGIWSQPKWCPHHGYLVRFSLRVQPPQHGFLHDNLAATNARFTCSGGETLEPPGPDWGEWGVWSQSCTKSICGIETRQEAPRGMGKDDTALNDVRFFCCNH
ncbi:vitelline membrane outer layer protein 1 homolog [Alligator sinensis]|uniref:Vitelline membrane outer layer protein 1 homolog n=1 Tax=Alligator sinensis TaxID=38654 RepID=A0A3Q0FNX5_ALLSI|nr:vitelline membrane outer layer protein 1 homolog [Alligator sinensis]